MASFALDAATGDLQLVNGRFRKITGKEEKAQKINARLGLFLGEWFLDSRVGSPWYEVVLVKNPDLEVVKQVFRRIIGSVEGIAEVRDVSLDFNTETRLLSYDYEALDDEGQEITGGSGEPFIVRRDA